MAAVYHLKSSDRKIPIVGAVAQQQRLGIQQEQQLLRAEHVVKGRGQTTTGICKDLALLSVSTVGRGRQEEGRVREKEGSGRKIKEGEQQAQVTGINRS